METKISSLKSFIYRFILGFALFIVSFSLTKAQCTQLIWSDEFNGTSLDSTKWNYDNGDGCPSLCQWGNNELQNYRSKNVSIENGSLVITAKKENYDSSNYTSGKITTKGIAGWTYGRFEARMKLPKGKGMWPAFWMLSTNNKYGAWPNSGELDIMELLGNVPNKIYGSVHFGPPTGSISVPYTLVSSDFSSDFHVFALEWNTDTLKWLVDNIVYSTQLKTKIKPWNPFDEEFYIMFNIAVGGTWPGSPDGTTVFPQTMEVDYVRVYGQPTYQKLAVNGDIVKNAKNVNFSVEYFPSALYNWTVPSDAVIVSGAGTSTINVNLGCAQGTVGVTIGVSCDTTTHTIPIVFSPLKISGDTTVFAYDTALEYSVPALNNTHYSWKVPVGATIISTPIDSNIINVNWGCKPGLISLSYSNSCETNQISIPVELKGVEFTGQESVAKNDQNVTYSVSSVPSATSYNWSVPSDATIVQGQGTNTILVDFGVQSGDISVSIPTSCDTSKYSLMVYNNSESIFCTFEASNLDFMPFASANFFRINNPFTLGIDTSAHIGQTYKSVTTWSGIYADLDYAINFSVYQTIRMKVYGPKTGIISVKIEDPITSTSVTKSANLTAVNTWQNLTFDFTGTTSNKFTRITLIFDNGSAIANTFFFDDIMLAAKDSLNGITVPATENSLLIYPIPAKNTLYVRNMQNITVVCISDLLGRELYISKIKNNDNLAVDISSFMQGIYLIKAISGNSFVYIKKFLKN